MLESDELVGPIPVRQRKFRPPFTNDELLRLRTLRSIPCPTYKIMLREGCRQAVTLLTEEGYRFRWRDLHKIRGPADPPDRLWHAVNILHYARLTCDAYRTGDPDSALNKFAMFMLSMSHLNVHTYEAQILRHVTAEDARHKAGRTTRDFAQEFAELHWRGNDKIRPHEMAVMILERLKDADCRLDNGRYPSIRTIRNWIQKITPRNASKGGRPRKSVLL